ncbi:hypothetical protein GG344DRAFT_17272, partial [Lentinula edodes]
MEFFSQFDCKIVYVEGDRNTVADALSRRSDLCSEHTHLDSSADAISGSRHPYAYCPDSDDNYDLPILCVVPDSCWSGAQALTLAPLPEWESPPIAATLGISSDATLLQSIRDGYTTDTWCKDLPSMASSMPLIRKDLESKLWYIGDRLIIPRVGNI